MGLRKEVMYQRRGLKYPTKIQTGFKPQTLNRFASLGDAIPQSIAAKRYPANCNSPIACGKAPPSKLQAAIHQ